MASADRWDSTGNRTTRRRVSAVSMARSVYFCGAPRRPDGLAVQALIASGVIQSVMSPRWTRAWSYSAQLVTRYFVLYLGWTREFTPIGCSMGACSAQKAPWGPQMPLFVHQRHLLVVLCGQENVPVLNTGTFS
jgi:hypothetical protein